MKKLLILILAVILFSACERKSGKLPEVKRDINITEKVVVLSIEPSNISHYSHYKVKRIEKGVVAFVDCMTGFSEGDTIFIYKTHFVEKK